MPSPALAADPVEKAQPNENACSGKEKLDEQTIKARSQATFLLA
jgi:hypothetical protein